MGVWTALSRSLGFLRVLVVAAVLGTTFLGNSFQGANSVSNILFEMLAAGALSAAIVPTFVHLLEHDDQRDCERLAGNLLGLALAALGIVTIVALASTPLLARALTAGVANPTTAAHERSVVRFLLPLMVPQILLYAWGAIATAVLYAMRRFAVTAAAPIGSTVAMIAMILLFRWELHGASPTLKVSVAEKLTLAAAGTLGVVGFVGVLVVAVKVSGFHLRPRWPRRVRSDGPMRALLGHSLSGVFLNATAGVLLGASIIIGGSVAGGVVAYQVALVCFLGPYGIFAQPIHTTALPELASAQQRGDPIRYVSGLEWAFDSMAVLLVPITAAFIVFAKPAMEVLAFGHARGGVDLLAAAVASLGLGLLPYSLFQLFTRALYAQDDSRTPAFVSVVAMVAGIATMVVGASFTHGAARVAAIGIGNSVAYLVGALLLWVIMGRRMGRRIHPRTLVPAVGLSALIAGGVWFAQHAIAPTSRAENLATVVVLGGISVCIYAPVIRRVAPVRPWHDASPAAGAAA